MKIFPAILVDPARPAYDAYAAEQAHDLIVRLEEMERKQMWIASLCGVNTSTVNRWKSGETPMPLSCFLLLTKAAEGVTRQAA